MADSTEIARCFSIAAGHTRPCKSAGQVTLCSAAAKNPTIGSALQFRVHHRQSSRRLMKIRLSAKFFLGALALLALAGMAQAQEQSPSVHNRLVVVELFQSQGCSSCPPAEANLNAIAGQSGILALSFGVTYWDDLGWKDTFASKAYTDRQWNYARHRSRGTVWTPQVYVNGHTDLVGTDRAQLDDAIAHAQMRGPSLTWENNQLVIGERESSATCDVWLVRYDTRTLNVAIGAGENGGRTLPHRNVVRELIHLGKWNGSLQALDIPPSSLPGLSTAALVQLESGGDIIGASIEPDAR